MSRLILSCSAVWCLLACVAAATAHATDYTRSYIASSIVLPTTNVRTNSFAIDLDGDNAPDNHLGQVLTVLTGQGFDFDAGTSAAVASGSIVHRVDLLSTDASFANDPGARATWCVGTPVAVPPLFDGTDNPPCDFISDTFVAALSGGSYTSPAPATTANRVSLGVEFAIGSANVMLGVLNARLSFTLDATGNMPVGQINGSIPQDDMMNIFVPKMAEGCNASIQSNPSSDMSNACMGFDIGCSAFPGFAGDGQIEVCELSENAVIQSLLVPDIQIDDNGSTIYAHSFGFRFTAIAYDRVFASGFEP